MPCILAQAAPDKTTMVRDECIRIAVAIFRVNYRIISMEECPLSSPKSKMHFISQKNL